MPFTGPNRFDRDIKNVPIFNMGDVTNARERRALNISSAATGSGVKPARPNTYGHQ
jgi:hypothetical protein